MVLAPWYQRPLARPYPGAYGGSFYRNRYHSSMVASRILLQNVFTMSQVMQSPLLQLKQTLPQTEEKSRPEGTIGRSMLVVVGIILLLAWIINYAVPLNAGSLIDLLLLFAAISFGLDYLNSRNRSGSKLDARPNWDRPPKEYQRRMTLAGRKIKNVFRGSGDDDAGKGDRAA